jgi:hypothetical protein
MLMFNYIFKKKCNVESILFSFQARRVFNATADRLKNAQVLVQIIISICIFQLKKSCK